MEEAVTFVKLVCHYIIHGCATDFRYQLIVHIRTEIALFHPLLKELQTTGAIFRILLLDPGNDRWKLVDVRKISGRQS